MSRKWEGIGFSILFVSLVGIALYFLFQAYNQSQTISPTLASAITTLILVIITAVYVYFTWKLASESKRAREQAIAPAFMLDFRGSDSIEEVDNLFLVNIGQGPAYNVKTRISLRNTPNSVIDRLCQRKSDPYNFQTIDLANVPNLSKDHYVRIDRDLQDLESDLEYADRLELVVEYKNQLGDERTVTVEYDPERLSPYNETLREQFRPPN